MKILGLLTSLLLGITMVAGCGSSNPPPPSGGGPIVDQPYETCYADDVCAGGLYCAPTTLPASTGFTGYFCTSGCNYDGDCLQLSSNYAAVCVGGQCYLSCPNGNYSCPYDQDCFTYGDIALCTP